MKKLVFTILIIFGGTNIFAQQSDYQIIESFNSEVDSIKYKMRTITSSDEADSLDNALEVIREKFAKHATLINESIYPNSYEGEVADLAMQINKAEERLLLIEHQNDKIADISSQVQKYQNELAYLNGYVDSLNIMIKDSQESEARLSQLVRQYREGLENRDRLVMDFVDSLMITHYRKINTTGSEAGGNSEITFKNAENPLVAIKKMVEDNTEYANATSNALTIEDYLRMYTVQKHFSDTWNEIGDQMLSVYGGNAPMQWKSEIESGLKDWRMISSRNMWKSLDQYLDYSEINTEAFDNNYSFYIALESFIKDAKKNGEQKIFTDEEYAKYKAFQDFWSQKFKNEWGDMIKEGEVLSVSQMTAIDNELSQWEQEVRPVHPMFLALIVLVVLSLTAYLFVMYQEKHTH